MAKASIALLCLLSLSLLPPLHGATLHVKSDGPVSGDGSSWANAFPKLQDALDAAQPGDIIWIAAGVYYPDEGVGRIDNDRTTSFILDKEISLYGGFNGTENALSARDPVANVTVLSGDLENDDVAKDADGVLTDPDEIAGSNSYHVVTVNGAAADVLMDGLTITGGQRDLSGSSGPDLRSGGGIYVTAGASLQLISCRIQGNHSTFGGGVFVSGSTLDAWHCVFQANLGQFGGALYADSGGPNTLRSCVIAGNRASEGGGAYLTATSSNRFINCTFHGNYAIVIDAGAGIKDLGSPSELINCVVWNTISSRGPLDEIDNNGTGSLSYSHTLVRHLDLSGSGGNLDGTDPANDPLFLEVLNGSHAPQVWGDFRQASSSPINDVGDDSQVFLIVDVVGNARVFNEVIDLGAVEYTLRIWYVDADAAGTPDGMSWATAFTDLQDALAAAINGDEIWVAAGVYRPGDGSDRNAVFLIDKTIRLYGGFAGGEDKRDDASPETNITVLSGDLDQNDTTNGSGITTDPTTHLTGDNAFTVCRVFVPVNAGYNTDPVLLTGFAITGGLGGFEGGGISVLGGACDTDIVTCVIRGNSSSVGGGISVNSSGRELRMSEVTIRDNAADMDGGAMSVTSSETDPAQADIRLVNVSFIDNVSSEDGGAIEHTGALWLSECTFTGNTAGDFGGALYSRGSARVLIENSQFQSNSARRGGALELRSLSDVVGSTFNSNFTTASSAGHGGAIYGEDDLVITDCSFTGNQAAGASASGGAVYVDSVILSRSSFVSNSSVGSGGALRVSTGTSRIENCAFHGNEGGNGGAAFVSFGAADFVNCAFGGNAGSSGGGVRFDNATTSSLVNCSFQGNSATLGGAVNAASSTLNLSNTIIWANADGGVTTIPEASIYADPSSSVTYTHCLLENLNPAGTGNLDGTNSANDPDFTAGTNPSAAPRTGGNLRLQAGSPAIDKGLNSENDTTQELDGLLRIAGTAIDLGAYEFGSSPLVTFTKLYPTLSPDDDENGNGLSNYLDYALGNDPTASFDISGQVRLVEGFLLLPSRYGAVDAFATWEKSTTLQAGSWDEMVEGVDYAVTSTSTSGDQTVTELKLLNLTPPIYFRQTFSETQ